MINGGLTRKDFIKLMAAGGASFLFESEEGQAAPAPRGFPIQWGRMRFQALGGNLDNWNVHPNGDLNLLDNMKENSSLSLEKNWNVADIQKLDEITRFPFLFMHSELPPEFDEQARSNLREYFLRGGFLFAEDCVNGKGNTRNNPKKGDMFFLKMTEELPKILPEAKFERLPVDHPIYHSYYHMTNGLPHMQGVEHGGYGLTLNGRLVAFLSPSDIHCGWTNGDRWFGKGEAKIAMQMGTNIYIHAMTQTTNI